MAYRLIDKALFCSGCNKSHDEKGVALCTTFNDLSQAVNDKRTKGTPKMVLMVPKLGDEFIAAISKMEQKFDTAQNVGLLGVGMFVGGIATGAYPVALAGVAKMFGARVSKAYTASKAQWGEEMPYAYCGLGTQTRQDDGHLSVLLPNKAPF
jgi:hypothetical protein